MPIAAPTTCRRSPGFAARAFAFGGLVLGLIAPPADVGAAPERGAPPAPTGSKAAGYRFARAEVERDLVLEIRRKNNDPFEEAKDPRLEVRLVNRSRSRPYAVVLPNDGSDAGWREPRISFTVERQTAAGVWDIAPEPRGVRCGTYAEDWTKDVVVLAPGAGRTLPWFNFPALAPMGEPKRVRIVAHYAYSEGAADRRAPPPSLRRMPSFELASAPLEIDVARPLALSLVLRGPLPYGTSAPLAPALDVGVENRSAAALPFATADVSVLAFEAELERANDSSQTRTIHVAADNLVLGTARDAIAAGQRRSALAPTTATSAYDGFGLGPPGEHVARVRARYLVAFEEGGETNRRLLWSPRVPVPPAFRPRR